MLDTAVAGDARRAPEPVSRAGSPRTASAHRRARPRLAACRRCGARSARPPQSAARRWRGALRIVDVDVTVTAPDPRDSLGEAQQRVGLARERRTAPADRPLKALPVLLVPGGEVRSRDGSVP